MKFCRSVHIWQLVYGYKLCSRESAAVPAVQVVLYMYMLHCSKNGKQKETGRRCKGSKTCEQHTRWSLAVLCEQMIQCDAQHGSASNVLLDMLYRDAEDLP